MLLASGCELRQAMYNQPKYRTLKESNFFTNGMSARLPVEGTVARGFLEDDPHYFTGMVDGAMATEASL